MNSWQRKVRPGDPLRISATAYNKFIDTAVAYETRQFAGASPKTPAADYVWAHNIGSNTLQAFRPVAITGVDSSSCVRRDPRPILQCGVSLPPTASARDAFMVLQEPIRPDTVGRAVVSGVTWCVVQRPSGVTLRRGTRLTRGSGQLVSKSNGSAMLLAQGVDIPGQQASMCSVTLGSGSDDFYATINSNEQVGTAARWRYGWMEVERVGDAWLFVGGRTDATYGEAINTLENPNTAAVAYSIPVAGTNFEIGNTGVRFRPVPTGAVVRMHMTFDEDFDTVVTFQAPNPVWGPCTALASFTDDVGSVSDQSNPLPTEEEQAAEETS